MKTCWMHRRALRNFTEGEAGLPPSAQRHLHRCAACSGEVEMHRALISRMKAERSGDIEMPFLRTRILNAIREEQVVGKRPQIGFAFAAITLCVAAACFLFLKAREENVATAPVLRFEKPIIFAGAKFETPYEKELANLRADTKNAMRALAANFMPETE